jgi:BirA family biotin operon repressor/biotin-[acetyl-CoA-carboxylase] ligase
MLTKISGLPVAIKWPNDLRIHGRKVGGILTERLPSGYLVIGIGININVDRRSFPEDLRERATSLKIESRKSFSLDRCLRILLQELDREYLAYLSKV